MDVTHPIHNPYAGEIVNSVGLVYAAELDQAIARSAAAFEEMRRVPAYRRAEFLRALAAGVAENGERLAEAIMREAGKPIAAARIEVQRAIGTLNGSAEEATRITGETLPLDTAASGAGRIGITRRFPIGPIAAISPFNFPLNLGLHKVGPALAAGNTVLWKPPLEAPGAALLFKEIFDRCLTGPPTPNSGGAESPSGPDSAIAGTPFAPMMGGQKAASPLLASGAKAASAATTTVPPDALQIVLCENSVAESLATDPRIAMLSFTGSAKVGWTLRGKAGSKKVVLELGGNAAAVVARDADLDFAAKRCAEGGYGYAGQVCIAVQRVIVHESIYEEFREKLLAQIAALKVGDPADPATQMGPMVSKREADRVAAWIAEAVAGGAKLLCGGKRNGLMFAPALFEDVTPEMKIVREEVFGPVVTLQRYSTWNEALAAVNSSAYGLQAGIFTRDIGRIQEAFETIRAGAVIVNDVPTFRIDSMPYGGVKQSGLGREGMRYAVEDMTDERLLVLPPVPTSA